MSYSQYFCINTNAIKSWQHKFKNNSDHMKLLLVLTSNYLCYKIEHTFSFPVFGMTVVDIPAAPDPTSRLTTWTSGDVMLTKKVVYDFTTVPL